MPPSRWYSTRGMNSLPGFREVMLGTHPPDRYGAGTDSVREIAMSDHVVPHFHNDPGVPVIEIGAREFMCIGATPPYDHPHVFCDMGGETEFICSYCSTLYRHNPKLH